MIQRLFLIVALILLLLPLAAHAQFSSEADLEAEETTGPQFGDKNIQLKKLLELQNQMQLLRSLIAHETSVFEMVKASIDIGVADPYIPAPDKKLCNSVPANIPCAQSYESLYDGYSVAVKKAGPVVPPAPSILADSDIPALNARDLKALPEPTLAAAQIFWTDITCLGARCSAVISPDPADPNARYRIIAGEKLPDGSIVKAISAAGVTIERDKKSISLEPAPQA